MPLQLVTICTIDPRSCHKPFDRGRRAFWRFRPSAGNDRTLHITNAKSTLDFDLAMRKPFAGVRKRFHRGGIRESCGIG
eukprot:3802143-Rhodomonas_salina.1